jgi:hypothetical protein
MRHVRHSNDLRRTVAGARSKARSGSRADMFPLRHVPCRRSEDSFEYASYFRSLLARLRENHRRSLSVDSRIEWVGRHSEHQSLALFTMFTTVWCFGGLFYLVGNDLEVRGVWINILLWFGLRYGISGEFDWYYGNGIGGLTEAWGTGGSLMEHIFQLAAKSGNWGAIAFGVFGMFVTGYFGYLLKRPMMRQAAENERFKATMEGYRVINEALSSRNRYLEEQIRVKDEYETILLTRLRECEERHMRRDGGDE